jgi:uncharacterized membrane protein
MPYSPVLLIHICAGTVALVAGAAALVFRKGSPRHVLAGRVFAVAMVVMAAAAVEIAVVKHQSPNAWAGVLTVYMVGTAWLTIRSKNGRNGVLDWGLLLIPLALGSLTWLGGLEKVRGKAPDDGVPVGMSLFIGTILLLAAAGDVRMLLGGGITGRRRIARHLWRMCFALFVATGSFFLGPNNRPLRLLRNIGVGQHLPAVLFNVVVYLVLAVAPLVLLIFWLVKVRFSGVFKRQAQSSSA